MILALFMEVETTRIPRTGLILIFAILVVDDSDHLLNNPRRQHLNHVLILNGHAVFVAGFVGLQTILLLLIFPQSAVNILHYMLADNHRALLHIKIKRTIPSTLPTLLLSIIFLSFCVFAAHHIIILLRTPPIMAISIKFTLLIITVHCCDQIGRRNISIRSHRRLNIHEAKI